MTKSPVVAISDIPKSLKGDISLQDAAAHEVKRYDSFKDAVNDFRRNTLQLFLKRMTGTYQRQQMSFSLTEATLHRKIAAPRYYLSCLLKYIHR